MKPCSETSPVSRGFFASIMEGTFRRILTKRRTPASTLADPLASRAGFGARNPANDHGKRDRREQ